MSRLCNFLTYSSVRSSRCLHLLSKTKSPPISFASLPHHHLPLMINRNAIHLNSVFCLGIKNEPKAISSGIDKIEWVPVYRFPLIIHARLFSRSKLYLTLITCLSVPYAAINYSMGMIPLNEMLVFMGMCSFSTMLMYIFGHAFRRLIGSIYISPDEKQVRISHLTFFGNRQDTVVLLGDILPLCDANPNLRDIFLRVSTDKSIKQLKYSLFLSLKFGGILNRDKFVQIFGSI